MNTDIDKERRPGIGKKKKRYNISNEVPIHVFFLCVIAYAKGGGGERYGKEKKKKGSQEADTLASSNLLFLPLFFVVLHIYIYIYHAV